MRPIEGFKSGIVCVVAALMVFFLLAGCKPNETKTLLEPSESIAPVLAEETIKAASANKKIAIITHDESWGPPSSVENEFKSAVEKQGYAVSIAKAAFLGDPMHQKGLGLQGDDFFDAVQNAAGSGAIVSFAGAPLISPDDAPKLPSDHPPILVVATRNLGEQLGIPGTPDQLTSLLKAKIIQIAIVNGESDSESSGKTDETHQLFAKNYTILRQ
jgi:hypothetical protein